MRISAYSAPFVNSLCHQADIELYHYQHDISVSDSLDQKIQQLYKGNQGIPTSLLILSFLYLVACLKNTLIFRQLQHHQYDRHLVSTGPPPEPVKVTTLRLLVFQPSCPVGFRVAARKWMHEDPQVSVHSVIGVERDLGLLRRSWVTHGICAGVFQCG